MDSANSIESLSEYELQLSQVIAALKNTPKGDEYDSLLSLKSDLEELISLTGGTENLGNDKNVNFLGDDDQIQNSNVFDDEYALFMKELSDVDAKNDIPSEKSEDTESAKFLEAENELDSLEGTQCGVYFSYQHDGAPSLYNAMICSVVKDVFNKTKNVEDIMLKVMFTNPTHLEMVPCPYFLDGDCKFDENDCRFSHGEMVSFTSIKEATKPIYLNLKAGSRVLAKISKKQDVPMSMKQSEKYLLWHRAIVKHVDSENCMCEVQLENNTFSTQGMINYSVEFKDIFPLVGSELDIDSFSDSDSVSDVEMPTWNENVVEKSLSNDLSSVKLGDWEKHTKGIGSRLMFKMGYVAGTGLGPQGEGRIQPVPCRIMPSGRSLDHCMKLREESSNEDPLKVEKRLRKLEKKKEEREKKAYERIKNQAEHNVFNFLNKTLAGNASNNSKVKSSDDDKNKNNEKLNLKTSSCKNLNIEKFKLEEDIKRTEKDVIKLKDSLARNAKNSSVCNGLSVKLMSKMEEINQLKLKQSNISNEQNNRKDKKKLTIF